MTTELHLKYRPQVWDQVLGQRSAVLSLRKALDAGRSRVFLFVGPSGVGKTTLARLVARHAGCSDGNILELSGSTHTGIDDVRSIIERLSYSTIDGSAQCVILDEAQKLSRNAWDGLLKILEEPPPGVYWCLCTTEGDKIPNNIRTRCAAYVLKPVSDETILGLLQDVKQKEQLRIPEDGLDIIVSASAGSVRQALVYLAACADFRKIDSIKEVLIKYDDDNAEAVELCRLLLAAANGLDVRWPKIAKILKGLEVPPETVRIIVLRYMNSVMLSGNESKATAAYHVASFFQSPFLEREGATPLTMACISVLTGSDGAS